MVNLKRFNSLLKIKKAPFYAIPCSEPDEILNNIVFSHFSVKRKVKISQRRKKDKLCVISKKLQSKILTSILNLQKIRPYTIGISSSPNDYLSLQTCSSIIYLLIKKYSDLSFSFFDASLFACSLNYRNKVYDIQDDLSIVVLYNFSNLKKDKTYYKSLLNCFQTSLKLVSISNMLFIDFFDLYLNYPVSGGFHIVGTKKPLLKNYDLINSKPFKENNFYNNLFTKDFDVLLEEAGFKVKNKEK